MAALALILGASTANAQLTPSANPVTLPSYARWSGTPTSTTFTVTSAEASIGYTATTGANWFAVTCGGTANNSTGDTCTINVIAANTDSDGYISPYTNTITLDDGADTPTVVTVNMPVLTPSPLSTGAVTLSYVSNGASNQSGAKATATVTGHDAAADAYTVLASSVPGWLTVTPTAGQASLSSPDTCIFAVVQTPANSLPAGLNTASVHLQVTGKPDLVVTVDLTVMAQQPLLTATTSLNFAYTIGGIVPPAQTASIAVASGTQSFSLDSTTAVWLGVGPTTGSASTSGATITFTPSGSVLKGLTAGNYSGSVGFRAAGAQSDLTIPVALTVSNPAATLSFKGTASNSATLNMPGATIPAPVVTVISSDEPTGFTATCTVSTTNPAYVNNPTSCTLSGASTTAATVSGIAYNYGTPLTTAFDPALFSTMFGAAITDTVTITGGAHGPITQTFIYTIQPIAPTFTAVSPTSAAQIAAGNSLVVTLTGTNFIGPGSIVNGAILPTQVFVGTTNLTTGAVVINPTTMLVSVPQTAFPQYPTGKTTVDMAIGLANQTTGTAPTAPTVTQNLVVTNAPVVYAVTSTATYLEPSPGAKPKVVPYELVSIFGENFGITGSAIGTLSSYGQFGTSVTSGSGTSAVTLSVSFKSGSTSYKAPILFANATQINVAVPAELTINQTAAVTVAGGKASSDGLFAVSVAAADAGIFTLSSQGVGPGAILNHDYSLNSGSNPAAAQSDVFIYMTGLGIPNSAGVDNSSNSACVAINGTAAAPGYLQVVNTSSKTPVYTAPSPAWSSLDGAAINQAMLLGSSLPPCFTTLPTVTFTSGANVKTATATYAGFVSGSVAGLYQINVQVPSGVVSGTNYVTVNLGSITSPAGVVTIAIQ